MCGACPTPRCDFEGLDDMRTLPLAQSYGCELRGTRGVSPGLYFRRARSAVMWKRELAAFVAAVEAYGIAGDDATSRTARVNPVGATGAGPGRRSGRRGS
jgi:hypothetical protein